MGQTAQIINLEEINANALPELQGWKEKQEALVKENPFIEITDNTTYTEAKKRRTALVKGRTTITNQDKLIASKLKDFRSKVVNASKELIAITLPHEEKQQEEVKRYEAKKEEERQEKIRKEEERKQNIKNKIDEFYDSWKKKINNLGFKQIQELNILEELSEINTEQFEEFTPDFNEKTRTLVQLFSEKKNQLQIQEEQRIEAERLAEERKKLEEEQRIAKEKAESEAEEKRKEQERIDAENQRKADELAKKEAEIQAEKGRLAKLEAERKAKEEAERKEKEETERKEREEQEKKKAEAIRLKRIEELKPDKEKIQKAIDSIAITAEATKIKNEDLKDFYQKTVAEVEAMKETLTKALKNLN